MRINSIVLAKSKLNENQSKCVQVITKAHQELLG